MKLNNWTAFSSCSGLSIAASNKRLNALRTIQKSTTNLAVLSPDSVGRNDREQNVAETPAGVRKINNLENIHCVSGRR
jgi:hypothetical protein